jgi:glycosyltransferase involved in cell wall biosynthesis
VKFSVLLPTRNRLEFLRHAVESVRRQDYADWELVISDNCSEDDIAGYVRTLDDPRIVYVRTNTFVPVTDNWNNALAHSTGDYVVMLGDDDALLHTHLSTTAELIERFEAPDVVYTGAYLYAYPGVMPDAPGGFLQPYGYAEFLRGREEPFVLSPADARRMVEDFFDFRVSYGFNMQFSVVSRALIDRLALKGPFYQSPFPDYYASNVMFLTARRIVACPRPLVVIGVTPKSYGFYHANGQEAGGMAFLNGSADPGQARRMRRTLLPGTNINTSWLFSLETMRANFAADELPRTNYQRYRWLQSLYVYEQRYLERRFDDAQLGALHDALRPWERAVASGLYALAATGERLTGRAVRAWMAGRLRARFRQTPSWNAPRVEGRYRDMTEVVEGLAPEQPILAE